MRAETAPVPDQPVRHARTRPNRRLLAAVLIAALCVLLIGLTVAVIAFVAGRAADDAAVASVAAAQAPPPVSQLPVPTLEQSPVSADICSRPAVVSALEAGDDTAAIEAAGGAEWFRIAVAGGDAPCIDLADPTRLWVVINKTRQYDPVDYWPADLMFPDGVRSLEGGSLRADASAALTAMVTAARDAGVGEIALMSGFRSFPSQMATYGRHVDSRGTEGADLVSARPGYSEHQSGLAGDVVPCAGPCGTLDDLAASAQGEWVAAHSWEYGWIARYAEGSTDVTGYLPEPWHLRYIGPELARAYHDGGWKTLEEFFGLPPAPTYVG
ncbi:M15 family metallopeptidase [Microbacterium sp.]|uniref:M15 family metallopeptidase n=1 Tax=Microbacterium sp. TaxID=51671 RepID=UPI0035B2E0BF